MTQILLYCTVQGLKYVPAASIIGDQSQELIGFLSLIFSGAPFSNVADNLDDAYLGPFIVVQLDRFLQNTYIYAKGETKPDFVNQCLLLNLNNCGKKNFQKN